MPRSNRSFLICFVFVFEKFCVCFRKIAAFVILRMITKAIFSVSFLKKNVNRF